MRLSVLVSSSTSVVPTSQFRDTSISTDNGINWTFIDTSNKDMATLIKALPNISPALIIPAQQPPVHYSF